MKIGKNIVLLSITIITLIALVTIATYSYFTASVNVNNKITTNIKMPLRPTFAVSGGGELVLTVTRNFTLQENAYNGTWIPGANYYQVAKNIDVTLTGEPGTTCSYNVYYKDTSADSTIINYMDFALNFYRNDKELAQFEFLTFKQTSAGIPKITPFYDASNALFDETKPTITIPSGSTIAKDTWSFILKVYNQNRDQSYLAGKTFKGEIYIGDVSCT